MCEGGELEDVERLVEAGRILVDVHHHGDPARTTEEELQEVSQFGLPEWNVVLDSAEKQILISSVIPGSHSTSSFYSVISVQISRVVRVGPHTVSETVLGVLVQSHGVDALPERQQSAVDVSRLLQPLSRVVSPRTTLRTGQVTQSQSKHTNDHLHPTLEHGPAVNLVKTVWINMGCQSYSLMPRTLGTPTSSTLRILMEKMLWLKRQSQKPHYCAALMSTHRLLIPA